ncbi:MAG: hypothetical protein GXP62_06915 [Oligoflexia bacterium]|nr:hypothetical protein [Oligoflexia bacterium]
MSTLVSVRPPLHRFGLVFLVCPISVNQDQTIELVKLAARAWFDDQDVVLFEWEGLSGELRSVGGITNLGPFIGQQFEAQVEGTSGTGLVRFLVTEAQLQAAWLPPAEA